MWGAKRNHQIWGFAFYDIDGRPLLKAGKCDYEEGDITSRSFELEEGEEIIGVKSSKHSNPAKSPLQYDLVFVIGRLE